MQNTKELSRKEMKEINGGGPIFRRLGEWIGHFFSFIKAVGEANIECPVSVAEWN